MTDLLHIIIATFATYRLALLLTEEEGPFELAARWRSLFPDDNWIGRGVRCPLCVSFWLALPTALFLCLGGWLSPGLFALWWLGIAGAVGFLVEAR